MSVIVTLHGRLGNNLFQYALGRIVAERMGFALNCETRQVTSSSESLQSSDSTTLYDVSRDFADVRLEIAGRRADAPVDEFGPRSGPAAHAFPLWSVLSDPTPRCIRLDGLFQRYEHFDHDLHRVRACFQCRPRPADPQVGPRDVLVDIRRDPEAGARGWVLPLDYYDRALSQLHAIGDVYLAGVGLTDDVVSRFGHLQPAVYRGDILDRFRFMQRFRRVILANSATSWWAALTSDATEIYGPQAVNNNGYAFTGFDGVDLHMGAGRYFEVPVEEFISVSGRVFSRMHNVHIWTLDSGIAVQPAEGPPVWFEDRPGLLDLLSLLTRRAELSFSELTAHGPIQRILRLLTPLEKLGLLSVHCEYSELDRVSPS